MRIGAPSLNPGVTPLTCSFRTTLISCMAHDLLLQAECLWVYVTASTWQHKLLTLLENAGNQGRSQCLNSIRVHSVYYLA